MSVMNALTNTIEKVITPIAYKVSTQPHVNAVKDGFVATMPFLIVGSLLLVLASPPGTSNDFLQGW